MSTRGGIARCLGDNKFVGRYNHFDSYPSGLGHELWHLYHNHFKKDLSKMLKTLIDDHPAGWCAIMDVDWNLEPGYTDDYKRGGRPICFCHGERNEGEQAITEENAAGCGCEWVYAFDEEKHIMLVFSSYNEDGSKMIGMFGYGNENAKWKVVATINLDEKEPNWDMIKKESS